MPFLILFYIFHTSIATGSKCNQLFNNDAFFTLEPLSSFQDFFYQLDDNSTIYFRFCLYTHKSCDHKAYAIKVDNQNNCTSLTGDQLFTGQSTSLFYVFQISFNFTLINQTNPKEGIQLQIGGGQNDTSVQFVIQCSIKQNQSYIINSVSYDQHQNQYRIVGSSQNGCPIFQISTIWKYLERHIYILTIIFLVIGILEAFFGRRMLKPTLFILGYFAGFLFFALLFSEFLIHPETSPVMIWFFLIIALLLGALIGYIIMNVPKIGIACISIWLALMLTLLIQNWILVYIPTPHNILMYALMVVLIIFMIYLSQKYYNQVVITSTSLFGAYLIVRPLGWFLGGFPSEIQFTQNISKGKVEEDKGMLICYIISILVIAGFGMNFQIYEWKKGVKSDLDQMFPVQEEEKKQEFEYVEMISQDHISPLVKEISKSS